MYGEEEDHHRHRVEMHHLEQQRLTPAVVRLVVRRVLEVYGQEQAKRVAQQRQLLGGVQGEQQEEAKVLLLVPQLVRRRRHFSKRRGRWTIRIRRSRCRMRMLA